MGTRRHLLVPFPAVHAEEAVSRQPHSPILSQSSPHGHCGEDTPSLLPMVALHMFLSPSLTPAHQSFVPQSAHNMDAMYSRRHTHSHSLIHAASLSATHGLSCSGGLLAAFQQPWTSSGADNQENFQWAAPHLLQAHLKPRLGRAPLQVSLTTLLQPEDIL